MYVEDSKIPLNCIMYVWLNFNENIIGKMYANVRQQIYTSMSVVVCITDMYKYE